MVLFPLLFLHIFPCCPLRYTHRWRRLISYDEQLNVERPFCTLLGSKMRIPNFTAHLTFELQLCEATKRCFVQFRMIITNAYSQRSTQFNEFRTMACYIFVSASCIMLYSVIKYEVLAEYFIRISCNMIDYCGKRTKLKTLANNMLFKSNFHEFVICCRLHQTLQHHQCSFIRSLSLSLFYFLVSWWLFYSKKILNNLFFAMGIVRSSRSSHYYYMTGL